MRLATRPPLRRIQAIDQAIRNNGWPNTNTLARSLEVTPRTVRRDVAYMRHQLRAPIEFDARRNGYFYTEHSYQLPFFQLTEGELVALLLAERVLQQYQGTPYAPDLARAFAKIAAGLGDRITIDLGHLSGVYSFRITAQAPVEPAILLRLSEAARRRLRVEMDYWTASRDELTRRDVDPYHITSVDGQWYLIGYCHVRGMIRVFLVSRVQRLEVTDRRFDVPADFRIDDYLGQSFSILRGEDGEQHRIRLRFRGDAARYVSERTWHPSQVSEETPEGALIVTLTVSHLREVERWALSWMPECEVLDPPELRERVAATLRQAANCHSGAPTERKKNVMTSRPRAPRPLRGR